MKPETRVVAWDDGSFDFHDRRVNVVGVVSRMGSQIEGVITRHIEKDGMDATEKISHAILASVHYGQLSYIMLDGICFGGFNIVDIKKMHQITDLPVMIIMRKRPNLGKFITAMQNLGNFESRLVALNNAGNIYTYRNIFYQAIGLSNEECEDMIDLTCTHSNIPEPLRIAHLIASGKGRA
jgi:endonuclease V-like protein UPF0215 family